MPGTLPPPVSSRVRVVAHRSMGSKSTPSATDTVVGLINVWSVFVVLGVTTGLLLSGLCMGKLNGWCA